MCSCGASRSSFYETRGNLLEDSEFSSEDKEDGLSRGLDRDLFGTRSMNETLRAARDVEKEAAVEAGLRRGRSRKRTLGKVVRYEEDEEGMVGASEQSRLGVCFISVEDGCFELVCRTAQRRE